MPRGAMYCTLVHILIYEKVVRSPHRFAIVFENDVCFLGSDFRANIALVAKEASQLPEGLLISLENSTLRFPSWREVTRGCLLYPAKTGRCAGASSTADAAQVLIARAASARCYFQFESTRRCRCRSRHND